MTISPVRYCIFVGHRPLSNCTLPNTCRWHDFKRFTTKVTDIQVSFHWLRIRQSCILF